MKTKQTKQSEILSAKELLKYVLLSNAFFSLLFTDSCFTGELLSKEMPKTK